MRASTALLLAALLLAPPAPAALAGPDGTKALGAQLADGDLEVAFEASKKLLALRSDAKPALPHLVQALGRGLSERRSSLHWHPWQGILPRFHRNVIRTLRAIGPDASPAVPHLVGELVATPSRHLGDLVGALLAIAPQEPAVFDALCGVISNARSPDDKAMWSSLRSWIDAQGARAVPALDGLLKNGRALQRDYAAKRLASLGTAGVAVLLHQIEHARPNQRTRILDALVASGNLRGEAIRIAVSEFAASHFSGDGQVLARALEKADGEVDRLLAQALADTPFADRAWRDLWAATPALARRTSACWVRARKPRACLDPSDADGLRRTALAGGGGGGAFEDRLSRRAVLTGLHVYGGGWGHRTIVRGIRPLFDGPEGRAQGSLHGTADGKGVEVRANAGYAVAGLYVKTSRRVDGLAVLFLRMRNGRLDPTDGYVSPWVAGVGGSPQVLVGGRCAPRVVGLTGRSGADLDAIGLVESER